MNFRSIFRKVLKHPILFFLDFKKAVYDKESENEDTIETPGIKFKPYDIFIYSFNHSRNSGT